MAATSYVENNLSTTDSNGNVSSNLYARNGKLISTMPLRLTGDAQADIDNGDDYYLTTKKYVDDHIADIQGDTEDLAASLSAAVKRVTDLEDFKTNFSVISVANNKPNLDGVATAGGLQVKKNPQEAATTYTFQVDVSDYAKKDSPTFTGKPTAPTPGTGIDDNQIATTAFVQDIKEIITGDLGTKDLKTIKAISTSLGQKSDFKGYVDDALNLKLDKEKISVTNVPVHDENLNKDRPVRSIATIDLQDTVYNLRMDISDLAPLSSPTFSGQPKAPDKTGGTVSQIATYKDIKQQKEEILGVSETENLTGGYLNVEDIAVQIEASKGDIKNLQDNKQPLDAALTSISDLISKPATGKYRIIYSTNTDTYRNKDISATMLELLQKEDQAAIASFLDVPRIVNGTITTTSKVTWDNLTAGEAVKAGFALRDGNDRDIAQTYATKDELGTISSGGTIVEKARKDAEDHVFTEHYLAISDGITKVSVTQGSTSGTKVGTIGYQKGATAEIKTDLFVDLSNCAKLNYDGNQTFTKKFTIGTGTKASAVAVLDDIAAVTGDVSQKQLQTLEDVINSINDDATYSVTVNDAIEKKQDKNSTLTAISKITTDIAANNILYTSAKNTFAITPITQDAITLISKNKTGMKSELGFVSSTDTVAGAGYATYDYDEGTKTTGTKKKISEKYVEVTSMSNYVGKNTIDIHDISGTNVTIEKPSTLGWTNATTNTTKPVSLNTLAFWDGRFNTTGVTPSGGTKKYSNLEYCKLGKFGDIVTHNFSEIPQGLKAISITNNVVTLTKSDDSTLTANLPVTVSNVTVENGNNVKFTLNGSNETGSFFVNPIYFGICATAANTVAKVVSIPSVNDSSINGTIICVQFSNTNTKDKPTLKVNTGTAYPITYRGNYIVKEAIQKDMIIPLVKTTFTDADTTKDCWAVIGSLVWTAD